MLRIIARTLVLITLFCTLGSLEYANAKADSASPSQLALFEDPGMSAAMVHQIIKCSLDQFQNNVWPYTYAQLSAAYDAGKLVIWHYDASLYMMEIDGIGICVELEF